MARGRKVGKLIGNKAKNHDHLTTRVGYVRYSRFF